MACSGEGNASDPFQLVDHLQSKVRTTLTCNHVRTYNAVILYDPKLSGNEFKGIPHGSDGGSVFHHDAPAQGVLYIPS